MVKLHNPEMQSNGSAPVMPRHFLEATKDTRSFKKGETDTCFITLMSCGRYSVMTAIFAGHTKHYEVFTEKELHESFNESNPELPAAAPSK
jgi:hypothetical protein